MTEMDSAPGGLRFQKCPTFFIEHEIAAQMWCLSEGIRLVSQKKCANMHLLEGRFCQYLPESDVLVSHGVGQWLFRRQIIIIDRAFPPSIYLSL